MNMGYLNNRGNGIIKCEMLKSEKVYIKLQHKDTK
jgi:hypothetical protein